MRGGAAFWRGATFVEVPEEGAAAGVGTPEVRPALKTDRFRSSFLEISLKVFGTRKFPAVLTPFKDRYKRVK